MQILVMRHGDAEAHPQTGDEERHITHLGSLQVNNVLNLAKQIGARVDSIATSPITRAKETARIASSVFEQEYVVMNALEPEGSPDGVYEQLSKYDESKSVLLVSHQPLVSNLVADLLGAMSPIHLKTGSLAMIKAKDHPMSGSGTLVFLLPPTVNDG